MQITSGDRDRVPRARRPKKKGWETAREESATSTGVVGGDEEGEMEQRGKMKRRGKEEAKGREEDGER